MESRIEGMRSKLLRRLVSAAPVAGPDPRQRYEGPQALVIVSVAPVQLGQFRVEFMRF